MGNIPIDIAADILCRSPAKSVARFASVSKAWASLSSDPNFAKLHCNQHLQNLKLIARHGRLYSLDLDSLDCAFRIDCLLKDSDFTANNVLGLSDHLLCLCVASESNPNPNPDLKYIDSDNGIIVICNLSTGARHIVPPSPVEFPPSMDPCYDRHGLQKLFSYGFGFDPSGNDYKLVRISRYGYRDDLLSQIKVYSMKTKSWALINVDSDHISRFLINSKEPVVLDGVLYWVAYDTARSSFHDVVVAFDLARSSFRQVPVPRYDGRYCLLSLGGKLCVMCYVWALEGFKFYRMEKNGNFLYWILFSSFPCASFCYERAVSFSSNGDKVLVEQSENEFLCCDLAKKRIGVSRVEFFLVKEEGKRRG